MFGAVLGVRLYQGQARYDEAERLFEAGAYAEARELYLRLGDEACANLCTERLNDARYEEAKRLLETGDYSAAEAILTELAPYKESAALLKDCAFLRAGDLAANGQPEKAREVYITLGNYPGVKEAQEALIPALYDRALELAQEGDLKQATTLWWVCNDYKDSQKLLKRADKALMQQADKERVKLNDLSRRFGNPFYLETYQTNEAYIIFPEKPNADTRFFLYFPGGRDTELYTEFLYYYLANPAPNTLAVFLRRNDLPDMEGCCRKGLRILDEAAADCGVFPAKVWRRARAWALTRRCKHPSSPNAITASTSNASFLWMLATNGVRRSLYRRPPSAKNWRSCRPGSISSSPHGSIRATSPLPAW